VSALAIEQAGAYMAETGTTPSEYLDLLDRYPAAMYQETAEGGDAQRTMARIWRVTLDHLADTPLSGHLLRLLAWYGPDDIPTTLLTNLGEEPALRKAIGRLTAYSMITHDQGVISVHRLVQAVTRTPDPDDPHRTPDTIVLARDNAIATLTAALNGRHPMNPQDWLAYQTVLPHARALLDHVTPDTDTHALCALASHLGAYFLEQGSVTTSVSLMERATRGLERIHGPDDSDTLISRVNLAYSYRSAGELGRAIPLYEATLLSMDRILGSDHPNTLRLRNDLASVYELAGDMSRAVPLFEAVLADRERILGTDHPDTLISRSNLAYAYQSTGDLEQAITLHETTVADCERVLSRDNPEILRFRINLARAYRLVGALARSIDSYQGALVDSERILGKDHPATKAIRTLLQSVTQTGFEPGTIVISRRPDRI
jgi:hypothetical protein